MSTHPQHFEKKMEIKKESLFDIFSTTPRLHVCEDLSVLFVVV